MIGLAIKWELIEVNGPHDCTLLIGEAMGDCGKDWKSGHLGFIPALPLHALRMTQPLPVSEVASIVKVLSDTPLYGSLIVNHSGEISNKSEIF